METDGFFVSEIHIICPAASFTTYEKKKCRCARDEDRMCFSSSMSLAFAVIGVLSAGVVWLKTKNGKMTVSILFFCLMEILQCIQYFVIADDLNGPECRYKMNQFLTLLGYVHIQLQPYFTNLYFQAFRPASKKAFAHEEIAWTLVQRLCLMQAALGLARLVPFVFLSKELSHDEISFFDLSKDWLEGTQLCTYRGSFHLAWSIPLAQPTYFLPGLGLHCFMMFAPVLCIGGFTELDAVLFLFFSGPVMATLISTNTHEAASIWCFFSTLQCAIGATSALLQTKFNKGLTAEDKPMLDGTNKLQQ